MQFVHLVWRAKHRAFTSSGRAGHIVPRAVPQGGGEAAELIGWGYGDYIQLPFEEDRQLLLNYLSGGETVDIYVEGLERPDEHHLFSVRPDNFAELYKEVYSQG